MLRRLAYALRCVQRFVLVLVVCAVTSRAQTTSFTYQGKLSDGGGPATGAYDFQVTLWDALTGGAQQPQPSPVTVTKTGVAVANGSFSVQLDFGPNAFPGADRFLETSVRLTGGGAFTILSPRQAITATPYSLQSFNAANATTAQNALQLGGAAANQYVQTNDSRLNDARPPTAGSTNYIQSNPSSQQAANFNINGNGTLAGMLSANSVGVGTTAPSTPLDLAGALSVRGSTAPPIAPLGQGRLYFDAALNKFRVSQNGSGFSDLVGSGGGLSGSGTTGFFPLWSNSTVLGNSVISQSGSNVVIGTTSPSAILDVQNSAGNALMRIRSTGNGSSALFLDRAAAIASNSSQIAFYSAGSPDFTLGTSQGSAGNSDLSIYDYGIADNVLTILKSSGNVGIGTTDPSFGKLNVKGGSSNAVVADSDGGAGVAGSSVDFVGVYGVSQTYYGVEGVSNNSVAVLGTSITGTGVTGISNHGAGVVASTDTGNLVEGYVGNPGIRKFHIDNNGAYHAGSDFAEALPVRGDRAGYEPGDVLVFSTKATGKVERANRLYDTRVAGVYSTRPGMLGADKNGTSRVDADDVPVAIVGIVPTKVSAMNGPIRVGDLLTTSSIPGYAMRCRNRVKCVGAIVGKALEPMAAEKGVIKVLVMLR